MSLPSFDVQSMLEGLRRWVEIESPTDVPDGGEPHDGCGEAAYREAGELALERVPDATAAVTISSHALPGAKAKPASSS